MTTFPSEVTVDKEDQAKLVDIGTRQRALQQMITQFQDSYERRAAALQQETQAFWAELGTKYGLDLQSTLYAANADCTKIVPVQVRLQTNFGAPQG